MTTDANDKLKDAVSREARGDSEDKRQKDSAQPRVYTEDEAERKFSEQRSVLDKKVTDLEKQVVTYQGLEVEVSKLKDQITQKEREAEERELESVRDDPDALKSLKERQRQRAKVAELDTREHELGDRETKHKESVASDLEQIKVFKRTQLAAEVSVAKRVDIGAILKLTQEDSREAMEATADLLLKARETPPLKLDSGVVIGGEDLSQLSPSEMLQKGFRDTKK